MKFRKRKLPPLPHPDAKIVRLFVDMFKLSNLICQLHPDLTLEMRRVQRQLCRNLDAMGYEIKIDDLKV